MKKKPFELKEHEFYIGVIPRAADGPGWANRYVDVIIQDGATNKIRVEGIQEKDLSAEASILFPIALAAYGHFESTVLRMIGK